MTNARSFARVLGGGLFLLAACSGGSEGSPDGAVFTPGDAGLRETNSSVPTSGTADVRFVHVFAPGGDKAAVALSVRAGQTWQRLAQGLAYGSATPHVTVPLPAFGDLHVVITPPGGDPSTVTLTADRTILQNISPNKKTTLFFFDDRSPGNHAPMPSDRLAWSAFEDRAMFYVPPAGKAVIQGVKQTISSTEFFWGWGLMGMGCLGGGDGANNERAVLDPGSYTISGVDTDMPRCAGATTIMPVTVEAAAGSAYFVFPVGEERAELTMKMLPVVP